MIVLFKTLLFISSFLTVHAEDCESRGKYGNEKSFNQITCDLVRIKSDSNSQYERSIAFGKGGMFQVSTDQLGSAKGTVGFRVFYLLPMVEKIEVVNKNNSGLSATHPSGVRFNFDKNGRISSPDVEMTVSTDINLMNKGGIEIKRYPKGLVIDVGYRIGASPSDKLESLVTVTDKNLKKCTFPNSKWYKQVDKYNVAPKYTTNQSLHFFFRSQCPELDVSSLLIPLKEDLKIVQRPSSLGNAPAKKESIGELDGNRKVQEKDGLDELIKTLESQNSTR